MSRLEIIAALVLLAIPSAFAGSVSVPMNVSVQVVASAQIHTAAAPQRAGVDQRTTVPVLTLRSTGPAPRTAIAPGRVNINF